MILAISGFKQNGLNVTGSKAVATSNGLNSQNMSSPSNSVDVFQKSKNLHKNDLSFTSTEEFVLRIKKRVNLYGGPYRAYWKDSDITIPFSVIDLDNLEMVKLFEPSINLYSPETHSAMFETLREKKATKALEKLFFQESYTKPGHLIPVHSVGKADPENPREEQLAFLDTVSQIGEQKHIDALVDMRSRFKDVRAKAAALIEARGSKDGKKALEELRLERTKPRPPRNSRRNVGRAFVAIFEALNNAAAEYY